MQRVAEEVVFLRRPDCDADCARSTEAARRAHDHALAEQLLEERSRVLPDLGEQEVADCWAGRVEVVVAHDPLELHEASALTLRRRASSSGASRLASAATCAAELTSKARRTLEIEVTSSGGPIA